MHENGDLLKTAGAVTSSLDVTACDNRLQLRWRGFLGRFLNPCLPSRRLDAPCCQQGWVGEVSHKEFLT